jgi:uncharacterized protein YdaU (DUF1376 family)
MAYSSDSRDEQGGETLPAANHNPDETQDMAISKRTTTTPAFQLYPREFLSSSKVIAMGLHERGAYITLLCVQWLDGGLPTDRKALARIVGLTTKQLDRIWEPNLSRCFVTRQGKLVNERLEIVRQAQIAYRKAKAENGAKGGRPEKAKVSFSLSETEAKKSSSSVSVSVSASPSVERTHRQGGAPIHTSHRSHAACGRVCVPAVLHTKFVQARNHDGADAELRAWYSDVDLAWTVGAYRDESPGADDFAFWRARFDERWPATKTAKPDARLPKWAQDALASKDVQ